MNYKPRVVLFALSFSLLATGLIAVRVSADPQDKSAATTTPPVDFITAAELKDKLAKNERVTIIDVRGTDYSQSRDLIKGATHVKLRRLQYRLGFAPLKDVPRDSQVVTYCACPNDEAAIRAVEILQSSGFKRVRALKGGWVEWQKAKGPVAPRPKTTG